MSLTAVQKEVDIENGQPEEALITQGNSCKLASLIPILLEVKGRWVAFKWLTMVLNVLIELGQAIITQENGQGKISSPLYHKMSLVTSCSCLILSLFDVIPEEKQSRMLRQTGGFYWQWKLHRSFWVCFGIFSSMIQFLIHLVEVVLKRNVVNFDTLPLLLSFAYLIAPKFGGGTKDDTNMATVLCRIHRSYPFFSFSTPRIMSGIQDEIHKILLHSAITLDGNLMYEDNSIELITSDGISELQEVANWMIHAGYEMECCNMYSNSRRSSLEYGLGVLGIEKLSVEEVETTEWSTLNMKTKNWLRAVKIVFENLLNEEKQLCERIFDEGSYKVKEVCFMELSEGCVMQLLNFGDAVAIGRRSPEKLFRTLDMYEALRNTLPRLKALFSDESGELVCSEARAVADRLGEAAKGTLTEFESAIKGDVSENPILGGKIHPLARYVMNYVKLLVEDYGETMKSLLENEAEHQHQQSGDGAELGEITTPLGLRLISIVDSLELNLEEKAKLYRESALQCIFLMNNVNYIWKKVKGSEFNNIFDHDWLKRRQGIIRKHATQYRRATWSTILACLKHEGIEDSSSNAFKTVLNERLKSFNDGFEEIYRVQTAWEVTEPLLKSELRIFISEALIPTYRSFLGRFASQLESQKALKYTTQDLEGYLSDLFEGKPLAIIRRENK